MSPRLWSAIALVAFAVSCGKTANVPENQAAAEDKKACTYVSGPDFSNHKACYQVKQGAKGAVPVYQGDIKLAKSVVAAEAQKMMKEQGRRATSLSNSYSDYFWPGGEIPYVIQGSALTASVEDALGDLETRSGVNFVARTTETDYLVFVPIESDEYCGLSYIGQIGGAQEVEINVAAGTNCRNRRVIQHEVMHALGFWHEQSRPDRDNFIRILWEHIHPSFFDQFDKMPSSADGVGPYDFASVMHYDRNAFSWDGEDTIQADTEANNVLIGSATEASDGDVKAIGAIYGAGIRVEVVFEGEDAEKGATFTYKTQAAASTKIKIGDKPGVFETVEITESVVDHEVLVTGLEPQTRYFYQVLLQDSPEVWSQTRSFLTDITSPEIIDPRLHRLADGIAEVRFATNENTEGYVFYYLDEDGSPEYLSYDLAFGKVHNVKAYLEEGSHVLVPIAVDEAGNTTIGDPITVFNDSLPPTISGVSVSGLSATGATISWTTNENSSTTVMLGTSADALTAVTGVGNTKNHTVALTGLTANTTYFYKVESVDGAGNKAASAVASFSTDLVAPTISGLGVQGLTYTSANIVWQTSEGADSKVLFGTACDALNQNSYSATKVTSHSRPLTGLSAGTSYCYKAISKDAAGNETVSATQTFMTPVIPVATISGVAHSLGLSSAVITWTTSLAASSRVEYGTSSGSYPNHVSDAGAKTSHSLTLSSLTPGVTYYYRVVSTTPEGGVATSGQSSFTISAADTITSLQVIHYYQNGVWYPRWVKASSSNAQSGATVLTLKVWNPVTNSVLYQTTMNYLYQENNYNTELPFYVAADLVYWRSSLQIRVESSRGGNATWSY